LRSEPEIHVRSPDLHSAGKLQHPNVFSALPFCGPKQLANNWVIFWAIVIWQNHENGTADKRLIVFSHHHHQRTPGWGFCFVSEPRFWANDSRTF